MDPHFSKNCLITCELESYSQWPEFKPKKSLNLGGLWRTKNLHDALIKDDLSCAAWRAPIPREILLTLQEFPECHAELIEMAQTVPMFYLEQVRKNPALTLLYATYWIYRAAKNPPRIFERIVKWENFDPDDLLHFTRFNQSKSFLRALSKIPIEECTHFLINALREHWETPHKRRLFQHLRQIKTENAWLLYCHPAILDPGIHRLAAEEPNFGEYTILEIVNDLSNRRELEGWNPWPYRNKIHTWQQLLGAYVRFLDRTNHIKEIFPNPPIEGIEDEAFHISPLKSRTALRHEAREMTNCIESFDIKVHRLECYAYKLIKPERATVLLKKQSGRWTIDEAMIAENENEVSVDTLVMLRNWLREGQN